MIYERWRQWCPMQWVNNGQKIPWCLQWDGAALDEHIIAYKSTDRYWYEESLLTYLYNHHQSDDFAWKLHWIGLNSSTLVAEFQQKERLSRQDAIDKAMRHLQSVARLGQTQFLKNNTLPPSSWDARFTNDQWQISITEL